MSNLGSNTSSQSVTPYDLGDLKIILNDWAVSLLCKPRKTQYLLD